MIDKVSKLAFMRTNVIPLETTSKTMMLKTTTVHGLSAK